MKQFIYDSCTFKKGTDIDDVIAHLNEKGQDGWELATSVVNNGTSGGVIFFLKKEVDTKRQKK